jgi:hypothetical protein
MSLARGRLLRPALLEIERVDVTATRAASGYDDQLAQPRVTPASNPLAVPSKGAPRGEPATVYMLPVRVRAQVEVGLRGLAINGLSMVQTGNQPKFKIDTVMHFEELEDAGLIDAQGHPSFRTGDRLTKILHAITGELIEETPDAYAVAIDSKSFGLGGADRNLLVITFESRAKGAASA